MEAQRPAPPVTIRIPGRPLVAVPEDEVGDRPAPRNRGLVVCALLALLVGIVAVATAEELPPPVPPTSADGLQVAVTLDGGPSGRELAVRLQVLVAGSSAHELSAAEREVGLNSLTGRGLLAEPVGAEQSPVLELGPLGEARSIRVDVVVTDCGIETLAPRQLDLEVERAGRSPASIRVQSDPDVVRALDRLVARTCGRPRG